ncbi:Mrx11 protein [Maudiozyma humilis]|uniref:Mrx11 protein n=1 Tax=Maudiozyma humilis TaxID=51915 RepID=A0AAV5S445_MAUHU|nr:Mrx11 protein [Kazachstania humilis]
MISGFWSRQLLPTKAIPVKILQHPLSGIATQRVSRTLALSSHLSNTVVIKRQIHQQSTQENKNEGNTEYQNEQIKQLIKKSKMLSRLQANPRYSHYFEKITSSGTISMITSFFILHELTAIIPLFSVWYILYNVNMLDNLDLSGELLTKCSGAIERLVGDKFQDYDKHKLIVSGAMSYAAVKMLGPARIIVSLWGAPYFSRWLVMPFRKLKAITKKGA